MVALSWFLVFPAQNFSVLPSKPLCGSHIQNNQNSHFNSLPPALRITGRLLLDGAIIGQRSFPSGSTRSVGWSFSGYDTPSAAGSGGFAGGREGSRRGLFASGDGRDAGRLEGAAP